MKTMQPLLSICIPTYNRSKCLSNLFNNLHDIKKNNDSLLEVCVSNNNSTDQTSFVIDIWRNTLSLKDVKQKQNIGGNQNIVNVALMASGKWILIIGDDDELIPENVNEFLNYLKKVSGDKLVLIGVSNPNNKKNLLGKIQDGVYSSDKFKKIILKTGLFQFGFIGSYVFNRDLVLKFVGVQLIDYKSWPHIYLFLKHLYANGSIAVYSNPIVIQDAVSLGSFFKINDWVLINLSKIDVIFFVEKLLKSNYIFCRVLVLRELYALPVIKQLALWKIYYPENYKALIFSTYSHIYKLLKIFKIFALPHLCYIYLLYYIPHFLEKFVLYIYKNSDAIKFMNYTLTASADKDCLNRDPFLK